MPIITACRTRAGICTAEFDDGVELRCSRPFAARCGIRKGAEIDEPFRSRLREAADEDLAAELARAKLRRRPHCRSELRWDLIRAGIPRPAVQAALDALHRDGEIDEAAYARRHAAKRRKAGASAALIRGELAARGVPSADIASAAIEAEDLETAREWARRSRRDPDWKRRRLQRMGFDRAVIEAAIDPDPDPEPGPAPHAARPEGSAARPDAIG